MFSTDFILWQQENLVDNQKCQAGFRPLCNKILVLGLFTATKFKIIVVWFFTCAVKSIVGFWGRKLQREWDFYQVASTGNVSCSYLPHTVILEIFNLKENALSNFAFQSSKIFIGTQNKKNFWNVMILFEGQCTVFLDLSEKLPKCHFLITACMKFDISWSQMPSFEVLHNSILRTFTKRSITSVQVDKLDYYKK